MSLIIDHSGAPIKNYISGQGSGFDMAGATSYCPRAELSYDQIEGLMRVPMLRNVVECVPDDITRAWRIFTSSNDQAIYDIEREYDLTEAVHEALVMSKMYGGCLVLPLYTGNVDLSQPLDAREKILGFRCIPQHLVYGTLINDQYQITFDTSVKKVHKSRVYVLRGKKRYDYTTNFKQHSQSRMCLGQSEIDLVYETFVNMVSADQQISHLLAKAIVDVRKQKGLMDDADRASRSPALAQQFSAKQQSLADAAAYSSNHQAIVCDMDAESVERLSVASGLGTLVSIPQRYTDLFVAATTYPRTKVLGEQQQGLNTNGGADMRRYYDRVEQYRTQKVYDLLRWADGMIEASEGIKFPAWEFGNLWQMTETEKIEYELKVAERDTKYYDILGDAILEPVIKNLTDSKTYVGLKYGEANTSA